MSSAWSGDAPSALAALYLLTGVASFTIVVAHVHLCTAVARRRVQLCLLPDADRDTLEKLGRFGIVAGSWLMLCGAVHVHTAITIFSPQTAASSLFPSALSLMIPTCIVSIIHAFGSVVFAAPLAQLLGHIELGPSGNTQFLMQMNQSLLEQQRRDEEGKRHGRAQPHRPRGGRRASPPADCAARSRRLEPLAPSLTRRLSPFEILAAHRRWDMGPDARAASSRMRFYEDKNEDFSPSSDSDDSGAPRYAMSRSRVVNTLARQFHDAAATRIQLRMRAKAAPLVAEKYRSAVDMVSRARLPDEICAGTAEFAV